MRLDVRSQTGDSTRGIANAGELVISPNDDEGATEYRITFDVDGALVVRATHPLRLDVPEDSMTVRVRPFAERAPR